MMRWTSACTVGRDNVPRGLDWIFELELLVLGLLVALEGDAVDHRIFDHGHDQPAAGLVDAHVLEQAGAHTSAFRAVIDFGGSSRPPGPGLK